MPLMPNLLIIMYERSVAKTQLEEELREQQERSLEFIY
jgi:hypothetical protein